MPDVSGFPALDVGIGLAFLFFLLSTASSAINEGIASLLGWRAKTLEDAIRNLLSDQKQGQRLADKVRAAFGRLQPRRPTPSGIVASGAGKDDDLTSAVLDHWRVLAQVRDPDSRLRRRRRPSYLPADAFSEAVVETLTGSGAATGTPQQARTGTPGTTTAWQLADAELFGALNRALAGTGVLRPVLQHAVANAEGTVDGFRAHVEGAFDDVMKRASGWYKRKVQVALLVIAAAFAIGLNVDTVKVGTRLWKDPAVRAAVVAKASASQANPAQSAATNVNRVKELNLPVGWGADNAPKNVGGAVRRLPGWLITIAALSLGAPFWFDLLSRFARLRGSGVPEGPRHLSDKGGGGGDAQAAA